MPFASKAAELREGNGAFHKSLDFLESGGSKDPRIENFRIVTKGLTRLDMVSRVHLGRIQGLATGDTGSRTTESTSVTLKDGMCEEKPEGQYGASCPSQSWESSETPVKGRVTSPDSGGAGDAPGLSRREQTSRECWEGRKEPEWHSLESESARRSAVASELVTWSRIPSLL